MGCAGSRDGKRMCGGFSLASDAPPYRNPVASGPRPGADSVSSLRLQQEGGLAPRTPGAHVEMREIRNGDKEGLALRGRQPQQEATSPRSEEQAEAAAPKKQKQLRPLGDLSLAELAEMAETLRGRLEQRRSSGAYSGKKVDLRLRVSVAELAVPPGALADVGLSLSHLAERDVAQKLELCGSPPESTRLVVSLDLPLAAGPRAGRNCGRLLGKIFLLLDQPEVHSLLTGLVPSLVGKGRSMVKDESGRVVAVRISFFLSSSWGSLDHLRVVHSLEAWLRLGVSAAAATPPATPPSNDNKALFVSLPADDHLALDLSLRSELERAMVSELHRILSEHGLAPQGDAVPVTATNGAGSEVANVGGDDDDGTYDSSLASLASILTLLSLLHHVDTTLRFDSVGELLRGSSNLALAQRAVADLAALPQRSVENSLASFFEQISPSQQQVEVSPQLKQIMTNYEGMVGILHDEGSCLAGFEGTYKLSVLSVEGRVSCELSIRGFDVARLFPSLDRIHQLRDEKLQLRLFRAKEREALSAAAAVGRGTGPPMQFTDDDFDSFLALVEEATTPDSFVLVYPQQLSGKDWVKVWVSEESLGRLSVDAAGGASNASLVASFLPSSSSPTLKVQGFMLGVTADQTFHHFYDPTMRNQWDQFIGFCQIVERFPALCADVLYTVFATPPGVQNRDFVEYRQVRRVPDGIVMLSRSCEHHAVPEREDRVRGAMLYSGYYFRNVAVDSADGGGTATVVTGVIRQDLGGYVPRWMLNTLYDRAIAEWMNVYITSCLRAFTGARYM